MDIGMIYNEQTRGLAPKKGYALKSMDGELLSDHEIFLGKFSKPSDYEEITMEEYNTLLKEQEEKANADRHEIE
nr:MAG TPA: hypothetical protein [Caudoviricetes sp.]